MALLGRDRAERQDEALVRIMMAAAPRDDAGELRRADEASQSDVCEHRRAHVEPHYVASQSSTSCSEHRRAHVEPHYVASQSSTSCNAYGVCDASIDCNDTASCVVWRHRARLCSHSKTLYHPDAQSLE